MRSEQRNPFPVIRRGIHAMVQFSASKQFDDGGGFATWNFQVINFHSYATRRRRIITAMGVAERKRVDMYIRQFVN